MAESAPPKSRRPKPPAWLVSNLVLVVLVTGFLTTDRLWLHWYSVQPDVTEADLVTVQSLAADAYYRADAVARTRSGDDSALQRISSAVAVLSLVQSSGKSSGSGSAQGRACIAYLMKGVGSVTDCGFRLVD